MNIVNSGSIHSALIERLCIFLLLGFFILAMPLSADSQSRYRVDSTDPHERAAAQLQQALGVIEKKLENASVYNDPDRDQDLQWALSTFFLTYKQLSDNATNHRIPPPDLTRIRRICQTMKNRVMPSDLKNRVARMKKEIERTEDELKVARTLRKNLAKKIKGNLALNLTAGTIEAMKSFVTGIGGAAGMGLPQIAALINIMAEKGMENIFMPSDMDPNASVSVQIQNARLREYYTDHREEINQKITRWVHEKYFTSKWQGEPCRSMEEYVNFLKKDASKRAALKRRFFDELRLELGNQHIPFLEELLGKQRAEVTQIEKLPEYKDGDAIYNKYKGICGRILGLTPWSPTGKAPASLPKTGVIEFVHGEYSASENNREVSISVIRKGGTHGSVWVQASASGGSAVEWQDFDPAPDNLQWDDGKGGIRTFTVYLRDDDQIEKREYVNLTLRAPKGGVKLGRIGSAKLWIEDNDGGSVSQDAGLSTSGRCKLLKVKPGRVRIKPGQTINLPSVINVIAVMEDLKERNVTGDAATFWEPGPSYTAPVSSKFNKRIYFVVHFLDCRATVQLDTEYPSWSPAISDAGDVNANVPRAGPSDYQWYVLCNKMSGDVVYGKFADPTQHTIMAGPLPGPRTAAGWIMDYCPRGRCATDGRCANEPVKGGTWNVICNKKTGDVTFASHSPSSLDYSIMAGNFRGEPEARLWQQQNCPLARCDYNGHCVPAPNAVKTGQGNWYIACNLSSGNIEICKNPFNFSSYKVLDGPFLGERDTRFQIEQKYPSGRCDSQGRYLPAARDMSAEKDEFALPGDPSTLKSIAESEAMKSQGDKFAADVKAFMRPIDQELKVRQQQANAFTQEALNQNFQAFLQIITSNPQYLNNKRPENRQPNYELNIPGPKWNPVDGWGGATSGDNPIYCPGNIEVRQRKCAEADQFLRSIVGDRWKQDIERTRRFKEQCCGGNWSHEAGSEGIEPIEEQPTEDPTGNTKSYEECLASICPSCGQGISLAGEEYDNPKCNRCKKARAKEIKACMEGR